MLRGTTSSAFAMAGTAVLRMVVSSDSMKSATATSQGKSRFAAAEISGARSGALVRASGRPLAATLSARVMVEDDDSVVPMHRSRLAGFIIDCQTGDLDAAATFWS